MVDEKGAVNQHSNGQPVSISNSIGAFKIG
jgi:hypothetical protein